MTTSHADGATFELRVAAPGPLVATKVHALADRSTSGNDKVGSDLLDVLALLGHHHEVAVAELRAGPHNVAHLVGFQIRRLLDDAERLQRAVLAARPTAPGLMPEQVIGRLAILSELADG